MGQAGGSPRGRDENCGSGTGNGFSSTACGLPSPYHNNAQTCPGNSGTDGRVNGYQTPSIDNGTAQNNLFEPYSTLPSTQLDGPPTVAAEDDSDSDIGSPHNQSLTITDRGEFILGPQWAVPDREMAQDMAGCSSAPAIVKSVQYSDEHDAEFTLTETIDDCDLSMSGGLSVNRVAAPPQSGLRAGDGDGGNCAPLFSCWDCTDATLPQPRPSNSNSNSNSSRMAVQPRNNDHHGSISGILTSSQQPDVYGPIAPEDDYAQRDGRHHRGHAHYRDQERNHYNGNRLSTIKEGPSRQIRRVKKFHRGSTYQRFEE